MTLLFGLAALSSSPALACGGLFCDSAAPVDQAGESIIFAVDAEAQQIEMHVQISYQGPAEAFSWLVPVPQDPEVLLSTDDVFVRIGASTAPRFTLDTQILGRCVEPPRLGVEYTIAAEADFSDAGGVSVAAQSQVGPYEVTELVATDVGALTTWLAENGYDLAPGAEDKLGVYVASGMYFVALKLQKDKDAGDLTPIALRYAGTEPLIPLQLTAVAAVPDMPLRPIVLGAARAVPENFLHVTINELLLDWNQAGANYASVVSAAADEAGGQAFATDFAGETVNLELRLWQREQYQIDGIIAATVASDLIGLVAVQRPAIDDLSWQTQRVFPVGPGTLPILRRFVDVPEGVAPADFFACLECFDAGNVRVDGPGLAEALELEWLTPMRRMQELVDRLPWITRLTSSISADEMTLDPRFVLNPAMPAVAAERTATLEVLCNGLHSFNNAPRRLVLADGHAMDMPSNNQVNNMGFDWATWTEPLAGFAAETIEQTGRSGDPVLMTDNRAAIDEALAEMNGGCGCDGTGGAGLAGLGLLLWPCRRSRRLT
jgi:hypothetical protein